MSRSPEQPCPVVFAIKVDGVDEYWTGELNRDGSLKRTPFRADGRKFGNSDVALEVADTHDELRDSDRWRIVPLRERTAK